jgi:hypothetical protein
MEGTEREPPMATLTLRSVPDELVEELERAARESGRSLDQEALARLEGRLAIRWPTAEEKARLIHRAQERFGDLAPLGDAFFARAKRRGRA